METINGTYTDGAFMYYVTWLDNNFAYMATMQYDHTSLTPAGVNISPPAGIWLIDTKEKMATPSCGGRDSHW
jgi:hypothetical protein